MPASGYREDKCRVFKGLSKSLALTIEGFLAVSQAAVGSSRL
jgi:hypothetical protein